MDPTAGVLSRRSSMDTPTRQSMERYMVDVGGASTDQERKTGSLNRERVPVPHGTRLNTNAKL